jgi:hypothetical protein
MKKNAQRKKKPLIARYLFPNFRAEIRTVKVSQTTILLLFPLASRYQFTPTSPANSN